jgi:hypothetical protein
MAMVGASNIKEIVPEMVYTMRLERDVTGLLGKL